MDLPRFFLPSPSEAPPALEPSWVVDSFVHLGGAAAIEVIVGLDAGGALRLEPLDAEGERLSSMRAHLAHAEVARPGKRSIECASDGLWLFALDLVEQLPDAPGPNDPIYLYGTLYATAGAGGFRGQLTTTRADLLRGFVDGLGWAFRYPPDDHDRVPRSFHALLPGDRADELQAGRGLVLAYPAVDPALHGDHAGNDLAVLTLLYDVLAALAADPEHRPASADPLPVPDRAAYVRELEAEGWTIDEDGQTASREDGDAGFLKRVFTSRERCAIPPQGTIEGYADRARAELARLPGWPSTASQRLFARVHGSARAFAGPPLPPPSGSPRVFEPDAPRAPRPPPSAAIRASRDEWMKDFIGQHQPPRSRLTPLRPPAPPGRGRPDWMKDFE